MANLEETIESLLQEAEDEGDNEKASRLKEAKAAQDLVLEASRYISKDKMIDFGRDAGGDVNKFRNLASAFLEKQRKGTASGHDADGGWVDGRHTRDFLEQEAIEGRLSKAEVQSAYADGDISSRALHAWEAVRKTKAIGPGSGR